MKSSFTAESAERLDRLIPAALPEFTRSRAQSLIEAGAVSVDGVVARKSSFKPEPGALVEIDLPELRPSELVPQDLGLDIVYQDADLAVLYKPADLVVHPSRGHSEGTLVHGLLHALDDLSGIGGEERPGLVHRLDKGTSGLLVVAKNDHAHARLAEQFAVHSVERRYMALVLGSPDLEAGRISNEIGRDPRDRLRMRSLPEGQGRKAITDWSVRERFGRVTLMECRLHTGRTHQVRVHMSEKGWPLLGDPLYKDRQNPPKEIAELIEGLDHQLLHAEVLGFDHPRDGRRLRFTAPPPADFQRILDALRERFAAR